MDFEDEFKAGHLFLENRKCRICGIEKSLLADFYKCRKDPNLRSSYSYECKDCAISRVKSNYARDPSRHRDKHLQRSYGITLDDYKQMITEQKNSCAICGTINPGGKHKQWSVDHDHKTNKVRGLLCKSCNIALGEFQDDIDVLQKAVLYLQKNKGS